MVDWATYPTPPGGYSDTDYVRGRNLYDYGQPSTAYDNFLRDSGVNPYAANPFTQTLRSAAAPLSTAYASEWARQGQPGSMEWSGPGAGQTPLQASMNPYDYATYMGTAMSNSPTQTQGRGVYGTLNRSVNELPSLINAIRQMNSDQSGNVNEGINPFLGSMAERLADNNGMGTVNYLAQLTSPMMASGLRDAYRNQLVQRQQMALRAQMNAGDPMAPGNDIWKYLLGV